MNSPSPTAGEAPVTPNMLDEFLDSVPDAVYFKDREGRFLAVSRSKAMRHGVTDRRKLVGLSDFDVFSPEYANKARAEEIEIMRTGQPLLGELRHLMWPDGRDGWGLTSKLPLHDQNGTIVGTFGVTRDITDLKRIEHDFERSQQALLHASNLAGMAEVATGVLHNIGNVLSSLNVSADLARKHIVAQPLSKLPQIVDLLRSNLPNLAQFLTEDPKGKLVLPYLEGLAERENAERKQLQEEIAAINKHVAHMVEIVTSQQSYARTIAVTEELNPVDVCEDAIRFNAAAVARHQLKVVREFTDCPRIVVQKGKLLQILVNFLQNAKNACVEAPASTTEKGICVRLEPDATGVTFSVTDNGVGIAPENIDKVFHQAFTTRKNGHGYGLRSCAVAAQQMGGTLAVHSAGIGCGATFSLHLPLYPPEIEANARQTDAPAAAHVVAEIAFIRPNIRTAPPG